MQNNGKYKLELNVQEPYFSFIKLGKKTVEGRLGKDKYFSLQKGDLIKINNLEVEVVGVTKYSSFKDMLITEGIENVIPDAKDLDGAVNVYYKFYSKEDEKTFGVAGISIKIKNV
jgi:ASC-1-like (ASCH) protein